MKLVRQYMVESGQPQRHRFIAREQSYHGNTLGALALGGHKPRRALYAKSPSRPAIENARVTCVGGGTKAIAHPAALSLR